jgi:hypothetical protein
MTPPNKSSSSSQPAGTPGRSRPARLRTKEEEEEVMRMTSPLRKVKTTSSITKNKAGSKKMRKKTGATGVSLAGQFVDNGGNFQEETKLTKFSTLLNQWERSSSGKSSNFDSSSQLTRGPDRETFVDSQWEQVIHISDKEQQD